jgi:glycosyltransferase involved in cell wall biosynthesis
MATIHAVRVTGPYRGITGYDHHVREYVLGLVRAGIAVELHQHEVWGPNPRSRGVLDPCFDALAAPVDAQVSLQFCMPHQATIDPVLPTVLHTMFEASGIPPAWAEVSRRCRLTLLPAESSRRAWLRSGVPAARLRLCPLGVDVALYGREHAPLPVLLDNGRPLSSYRRRFLNVTNWVLRKNLTGLIRAWLRATTNRDDAALVLKLGLVGMGTGEVLPMHLRLIQESLGKALAEAAPIHVITETLLDEEMPRLYAAATHYWSMSHGEAWDLPMTEACASGLTPVAPDHSAYPTYLDRSSALLIPSAEVPAHRQGGGNRGSLFAGLNWWKPDEDAAVAIIRAILDRDLAPAESPRQRILRDYSWTHATDRLIACLDEALTEPAPSRRRSWSPFRARAR